MSVKAITAVFYESDLRDSVRFVLLAIADHCDEERLAYPSIGLLKSKTGVKSEDTIRARIWAAIDGGELEVAWYAGEGRAHLYWVKTGLGADAEAPDAFKEAQAVSAQKLASGRYKVPKRVQEEFDAAEEEARRKESDALAEKGAQIARDKHRDDPPKIRGSEETDGPPKISGAPPKSPGCDPPNSLGTNPQEPEGNPRARESEPGQDSLRADPGGGETEDVRGVRVGVDGVAAFTEAADAIVARWGEGWWASWLVGSEARPANGDGVPWRISCKTRFIASKVAQQAGEMFEDLLGSKVVFEAMAVPPKPAVKAEAPADKSPKKRRRGKRRGSKAA